MTEAGTQAQRHEGTQGALFQPPAPSASTSSTPSTPPTCGTGVPPVLLKRDRATPAQLRAIFAAAAQRGLRDDVRELCGVTSMKQLTRQQAQRLLDSWNGPPRAAAGRAYNGARRGRRLAAGVVRPATRRQRHAIARLLRQIGWPAKVRRGWLLERYGVRCVHCHALSTSVASQLITQLGEIQRKGTKARRHEGTQGLVAPASRRCSVGPPWPTCSRDADDAVRRVHKVHNVHPGAAT